MWSSPRAAPRRAPGFSLVELLVVIAIVALLIGILLPALGRAREASRAAVCLSNQRQIGTAAMLYANQNDDHVPREGFEPNYWIVDHPPWPLALRPFIDERVGGDWREPHGDFWATAVYYRDPARPSDGHLIHYVVNAMPFVEPGRLERPSSGANGRGPTRITAMPRPYDTIYIADFADDPSGGLYRAWYRRRSEIAIAQFYDVWDELHIDGPPNGLRAAATRHRNGSNAVFMDGHAALVPAADIRTLDTWDDGVYNAP